MKRRLLCAAGLAAAVLLSGCTISLGGIQLGRRKLVRGQGEEISRITRLDDAGELDACTLSIADVHLSDDDISLTVAPTQEDTVTLKGPQNLLDSLEVTVDASSGAIRITGDDRLKFTDADLDILVGMPLKSLSLAGGVDLEADLPDTKTFALTIAGAVDGEIAFGSLDSLAIEINGAGDLSLSGNCAAADITVNGAGNIDADALLCTDACVTINGAGSCEIFVNGTLDATVNGVGTIQYCGNPQTVTRSGGGISAIKEK